MLCGSFGFLCLFTILVFVLEQLRKYFIVYTTHHFNQASPYCIFDNPEYNPIKRFW